MKVVYLHRTADTNEVFYVGSGGGYRPHSRKPNTRNDKWHEIVEARGLVVEIVDEGLTAVEARELEKRLVLTYCHSPLLCNVRFNPNVVETRAGTRQVITIGNKTFLGIEEAAKETGASARQVRRWKQNPPRRNLWKKYNLE